MATLKKHPGFVNRLISSMISAGYGSTRSPSGVDINKLCDLTNSTPQNCRRFIRGEALPDFEKIITMSKAFGVNPGWLLFGNESKIKPSNEWILIKKEILKFLFEQAGPLYQIQNDKVDLAIFLTDLLEKVIEINSSDEDLKKILKIAVNTYIRPSAPELAL